jgi:hypothetical protein
MWSAVVWSVDFDGELEVRPVEVDFEAVEVGVDEGLIGGEREEGVFGAASGPGTAAVRWTVVTGMPLWVVTSRGSSER